jgi:hypothetical protein
LADFTKHKIDNKLLTLSLEFFVNMLEAGDRLCGLVVRVLGYRSGGPGFDSRHYKKKNVVGLERGALSLVSTN